MITYIIIAIAIVLGKIKTVSKIKQYLILPIQIIINFKNIKLIVLINSRANSNFILKGVVKRLGLIL